MYWNLIEEYKEGRKRRLNTNMGCIETRLKRVFKSLIEDLNTNMGCIET